MDKQAMSQVERNRRSHERLGKKQKLFALDAPTLALFDELGQLLGVSHTEVLRRGLQALARDHGLDATTMSD